VTFPIFWELFLGFLSILDPPYEKKTAKPYYTFNQLDHLILGSYHLGTSIAD